MRDGAERWIAFRVSSAAGEANKSTGGVATYMRKASRRRGRTPHIIGVGPPGQALVTPGVSSRYVRHSRDGGSNGARESEMSTGFPCAAVRMTPEHSEPGERLQLLAGFRRALLVSCTDPKCIL